LWLALIPTQVHQLESIVIFKYEHW
jgi:hypothetical protein